MEAIVIAAFTAAIAAAELGLHVLEYLPSFRQERNADKSRSNGKEGKRALWASFYHLAGCNLAFGALKALREKYGASAETPLRFEKVHQGALIYEDESRRYALFLQDLNRHVQRLKDEVSIADRVLDRDEGLHKELLKQLSDAKEDLKRISQGSGVRTLSSVGELIESTLADVQREIGDTLKVSAPYVGPSAGDIHNSIDVDPGQAPTLDQTVALANSIDPPENFGIEPGPSH